MPDGREQGEKLEWGVTLGGGGGQEAPKMLQKREAINTGTKRDKQDRGRVMMPCP